MLRCKDQVRLTQEERDELKQSLAAHGIELEQEIITMEQLLMHRLLSISPELTDMLCEEMVIKSIDLED